MAIVKIGVVMERETLVTFSLRGLTQYFVNSKTLVGNCFRDFTDTVKLDLGTILKERELRLRY